MFKKFNIAGFATLTAVMLSACTPDAPPVPPQAVTAQDILNTPLSSIRIPQQAVDSARAQEKAYYGKPPTTVGSGFVMDPNAPIHVYH